MPGTRPHINAALSDWQAKDWKALATTGALAGAFVLMLVGAAFFALSFRPARWRIDPGDSTAWRLTVTATPLSMDNKPGQPRTDIFPVELIGIGPENQCALLAPVGAQDRLSLLRIDPIGSVLVLDAAGRETDGGRMVGPIDFNLFALPAGAEQVWEVSVPYHQAPPAKRLVQARARRTKQGSHPEFELKFLSSLEWLQAGRYRQVRDLRATYKMRGGGGTVEHAQVRFLWGVENERGVDRWRIGADLALVQDREVDDAPERLRDLARAIAEGQEILAGTADASRSQQVIARLRGSSVVHPRLRRLAAIIAAQLAQPRTRVDTRPPGQALVVAAGPAEMRNRAEHLVEQLKAAGWQAWLQGGTERRLEVLVGTWQQRDPAIIERLRSRFPDLRPAWTEVR